MMSKELTFIKNMAKDVRVVYFDTYKPDTGEPIPIPYWAKAFLNTFYSVQLKSYSWDRCQKIPNQQHHFLYSYHYKQVSPILASLLDFDIDNNKYIFVSNVTPYGDFSYCIPKGQYSIQKYNCKPLIMDGRIIVGYNNPYYNENGYYRNSPYHKADLYPHSCSTVENLVGSGKTILVSGDSHFIPQMARLVPYFKEITYLDYREKKQRNPPTKVYDYLLFAISANHNERHYLKNLGL